ncbi:uncharacterized protein LOC105829675 isoform X2 [Monomorium pharaonis]|uniref:uncharacterized protein LOC105829675 isoform X2 n=1 Tax=Monomorium pharaonis TaxID=307658 RepID=UPI00102E1AFB|nr:uncharacterized protein LOC105829675 isoform X2 [Monomorium pharaonis]
MLHMLIIYQITFYIGMQPSLVSSVTSVSSSGVSSEEKVPLGHGIFCSKAAYNKLINIENNHADWAYALLKEVFGEKAHRMRVRVSSKYTENEKFSENFLMVAKCNLAPQLAFESKNSG